MFGRLELRFVCQMSDYYYYYELQLCYEGYDGFWEGKLYWNTFIRNFWVRMKIYTQLRQHGEHIKIISEVDCQRIINLITYLILSKIRAGILAQMQIFAIFYLISFSIGKIQMTKIYFGAFTILFITFLLSASSTRLLGSLEWHEINYVDSWLAG